MGRTEDRRPSMWRSLLFVAGVGLGALTIASIFSRRRSIAEPAGPARLSTEAPAAPAITLHPPPEAGTLSLRIEAIPETLVNGEDGRIRALTAPGATCLISARYSTGRPPVSLDIRPRRASSSGVCEWVWSVRTSGSWLDVEVQAWLEDHLIARAEKRFEVARP